MDIHSAILERHSVRNYVNKKIGKEIKSELLEFITQCNKESGLNVQLVTDEPKAFDGFMAHYGKFKGVSNYIALIGKKSDRLEEEIGYYGEKIAIKAQMLGLNTCWVALTFSKGITKKNVKIDKGEAIVCVLSLGYGETMGNERKSKSKAEVSNWDIAPKWFESGIDGALLAPTAMNQQKFFITYKDNNKVEAKSTGGFYSKVDLGIVKYHFEVFAGKDNFEWI